MKVLILGFTKIKYMPYLNIYLSNLDFEDNNIELVIWNRDGKDDIKIDKPIKIHEFKYIQKDEVKKIKKIKAFYQYRKFCKKIIRNGNFDKIIVLHTLPGIILSNILIKKYKNKYILDYRDYTYEYINVYKSIIGKLVLNSAITLVSSDAYRENLPKKDEIYTIHNILLENQNDTEIIKKDKNNLPIKIRFWGFIRHEKINKEIIKKISSDNRFELHYHGREQQTAMNLKEYCKEINAKNIFFHGEYYPKDRYEFAKDTDLIHNIYENDKATILAMGNKYYDGILFKIPQICNKSSFMGKCVTKNNIGIELNPYNDSFTNELYQYYKKIEIDELEKKYINTLNEILEQNESTIMKIKNYIEREENGY